MKLKEDLALIVTSSGIGDGEPDLGEKLMKSYLTALLETGTIPARMIFINSGVFLTTEGSPVIDTLRQFDQAGAEVLSCGTCLEYYGRADKLAIGDPTNMKVTVNTMLDFSRVVKI